VIIPLDVTQLPCPGFALAAGLPSGFTTDGVGAGGGALWRACNLTSFSPCLTGPVDYPFASCHKGPGFNSPGGYLCETGILLLALSRYSGLNLAWVVGGRFKVRWRWKLQEECRTADLCQQTSSRYLRCMLTAEEEEEEYGVMYSSLPYFSLNICQPPDYFSVIEQYCCLH
jgi:hypothetical protein